MCFWPSLKFVLVSEKKIYTQNYLKVLHLILILDTLRILHKFHRCHEKIITWAVKPSDCASFECFSFKQMFLYVRAVLCLISEQSILWLFYIISTQHFTGYVSFVSCIQYYIYIFCLPLLSLFHCCILLLLLLNVTKPFHDRCGLYKILSYGRNCL